MEKNQIVQRVIDRGVLPVFRTDLVENLIPASLALIEGGLDVVEYTMTMPGALKLIEKGRAELPAEALLGAGTVLDAETARAAILAGAQFLVSPGLATEVIEVGHRYGVPVVPGAVTPTEIMEALRFGVDLIKVFPSNVNMAYFADLIAPFPRVKFLAACGGITTDVMKEYFTAGAKVVTLAGQNMDAEGFARGRFEGITKIAKQYVQAVRDFRGT
ncbi:MAG: bifunctional 4-hydroxy-2-oxoglutarate aldolase/2-dehydro-3-deoxy-phosphogluconate aldolase [Phycisphaerae bacterium]|nr:bifunctional 4-hydroxy-2-oxoglutarate aldolase/2-dehydro-3-deoxy-phosphogluconate aldolase [Phycisphaerae bacterium]